MKKQLIFIPTRKILASLILFFLAELLIVVQAQYEKDQEIIKRLESKTNLLGASARQKVTQTARLLGDEFMASNKNTDLYAISLSKVKEQFKGSSSEDIDVIVMLVMFDLWKSEGQDIKEITDEMNKMNKEKLRQQELLENLKKNKISAEEKIKESIQSTAGKPAEQVNITNSKIVKETARTALLKTAYTKTPKLNVLKEPGQMSLSELEQAINTTKANIKTLEEYYKLNQFVLQKSAEVQNRNFTCISNVMRTKHDTAKDAIQNIR